MSGDPYRSAERVPTKRRVEADETIERSETKLGPLQQLFIPTAVRERIEQLRSASKNVEDDDARVALANALEEALVAIKERELDLHTLPVEPPEAPPLLDAWGPTGTETAAAPIVAKVEALSKRSDRDAVVLRTGPRITARFASQGTPILWSIHLGAGLSLQESGTAQAFATSSHWMGTSVRQGIPNLFIRAEGLGDTVLKALRLRSEVEVGDKDFDDIFFVEGENDFARALLMSELRKAFVRRAHFGDFTFALDGPAASLAWKGSLPFGLVTEEAAASSIENLVALRASLGRLRLLRAD